MNPSIDPETDFRTMILLYIEKDNDGKSEDALNENLAKKNEIELSYPTQKLLQDLQYI
jgi:hypothetical protein